MSDVAGWIVSTSKVAAFTSGPDGIVVGWNRAAASLLGVPARDALGAPCHLVLAGRDAYGNRYCGPSCPVRRMAWCSEVIHRFPLAVGEEDRAPLPVWVSVVAIGGDPSRGPELVHLLEPILSNRDLEPTASDRKWSEDPRSEPQRRLPDDEAWMLGLIRSRVPMDVVAKLLGVGSGAARSLLLTYLRRLEAQAGPGDTRLAERLSSADRKKVG